MSHHQRTVQSSPPPATDSHLYQADLAALASQFHEATQALLALCQQTPACERALPTSRTEQKHAEEGETRCYYYSPAVLHHERQLLQHYRAQNLPDLLEETHLRLVGLVKLMKSVHADVRVKGHVINSLGYLLEQACALVLRMNHLYAKVQRVEPPAPVIQSH